MIGYSHTCGPKLFDEIATEMANRAKEISSSSAQRLYNSLINGFSDDPILRHRSALISSLQEPTSVEHIPSIQCPAKINALVACRVMLDRYTGKCPVTKTQQHIMNLSTSQKRQIYDGLFKVAKDQYDKSPDKKHNDSAERAVTELKKFSDWLEWVIGDSFAQIAMSACINIHSRDLDLIIISFAQIIW